MKVKNLIIGIIAIAVIGVIIFFALKMTKDIKNNDVNSANVVEAESEEVVNDASNVIEDGNENENENNESSCNTSEDENEETTESNETEETEKSNGCSCGCGDNKGGCC